MTLKKIRVCNRPIRKGICGYPVKSKTINTHGYSKKGKRIITCVYCGNNEFTIKTVKT